MTNRRQCNVALAVALALGLSGCGGNLFRSGPAAERSAENVILEEREASSGTRGSIMDLFVNRGGSDTNVNVNRYIWSAALEVLDFLPVETVDPFSGVFSTGFGTPPGGGRPYRATVHVTDAALDARALNVALITRAGPASPDTVRAVENAILNRARQLRIRDRGM